VVDGTAHHEGLARPDRQQREQATETRDAWDVVLLHEASRYGMRRRADTHMANPLRQTPLSRLLALGLALALLLSGAQSAYAHAVLVKATPAPNAELATAPADIQIWFSEPLSPSFSSIKVVDALGSRVDNDDSAVDAQDPTHMTVSLRPLGKGIYTVVSQNVSDIDGHKVVDSYAFSVDTPLSPNSQPAAPQAKQPLVQYALEPVVRWFVLLGALGLAGGLFFDIAVADGALARAGRGETLQRVRLALTRRRKRLLWVSMGMLLTASVVQLIGQTVVITNVSPLQAFGSPVVSVMTESAWGRLWLWRMASSLTLCGLLLWAYGRAVAAVPGKKLLPKLLALLAAGGVLLTLSLSSHGAATPQVKGQAVFTDYLHLLSAGLWFGGLLHFATSIPLLTRSLPEAERRSIVSAFVPRFTFLASLSVGVLIITGIYSAWAQVTVWRALSTPYGGTLLVKVGLVAPMLLLAAANLVWVRPRLKAEGKADLWLGRFVTGEAVLGLLVLATVGFLTSLNPARQAVEGTEAKPTQAQFAAASEGMDITTTLTPGGVGRNELTVSLKNAQGRAVDGATVEVQMQYLDADLGLQTGVAVPQGNGRYLWQGPVLSVAGLWQGQITVRTPSAFDAHAAFRIDLARAASTDGTLIVPAKRTSQILLAAELGLIGVVFLLVGFSTGGMATQRGLVVICIGALLIVGGFGVGANLTSGGVTTPARNPFPPDEASLAVGARIYSRDCASCHGELGHGDGPLAATLNPKPFDLVVHVPMHTDASVFATISNGMSGTAMGGFKGKLTEDERWHLVNYLRALR